MSTDSPIAGLGSFRWNAGGWFGSQIGGTSWLLIGATMLAPRAPAVAIVWLACCALANAVGLWFWRRRTRVRPHTALQLLLLACGICGLLAWLALDLLRPELAGLMGWPRRGYRMLLIIPAIMAWFAVMEYTSRVRSGYTDRPERSLPADPPAAGR